MHALDIKSKPNKPSFNVINIKQDESNKSVKVIDRMLQRRATTKGPFYSIEISNFGNLLLNFNDFAVQPLFTSVTWFKDNLEVDSESVEPAVELLNAITSPTILHLTCYKLSAGMLDRLLKMNFSNILALRGDIVTQDQPLKHAIDLVKLIKQKIPHMSLSVGGYPETHPEASSPQSDINYLKDKVDSGADFIILQICFSTSKILRFIKQCREVGIKVPIIPGIFIPFSYNVLLSMCQLCKVTVPEEDFKIYKMLKDDTKAFQDFAVQNTINILNDLFSTDFEPILGIHFFTLNKFELMKHVINFFDFK